MAMPQRDETIEEIKRLDALQKNLHFVIHGVFKTLHFVGNTYFKNLSFRDNAE